jgi:hypothetical protein
MIENKVASSGLITLNLEDYLPNKSIITFDLKDYLFMGLILKEKDYRETLKNKDWEEYRDQYVAITCSADAIVPVWAYMLAVSYLQPVATDVYMGTAEEMNKHILLKNIDAIKPEEFADQRVVVKGCGDKPVDNAAFAEITKVLLPLVKSIMYGEPCSTVPIYKKK